MENVNYYKWIIAWVHNTCEATRINENLNIGMEWHSNYVFDEQILLICLWMTNNWKSVALTCHLCSFAERAITMGQDVERVPYKDRSWLGYRTRSSKCSWDYRLPHWSWELTVSVLLGPQIFYSFFADSVMNTLPISQVAELKWFLCWWFISRHVTCKEWLSSCWNTVFVFEFKLKDLI